MYSEGVSLTGALCYRLRARRHPVATSLKGLLEPTDTVSAAGIPDSRVGTTDHPRPRRPASVNERFRGAADSRIQRATLLVVDDEEMVRRLAARMLATLGYHVLEARDGQDAVRVLQRDARRIQAVLTDVAMPGLGGRQLGETIARCWPEVRVLYMSGFPAQRVVAEGAIDATKPFMQKPFTEEQLGRKVRELLARPVEQ